MPEAEVEEDAVVASTVRGASCTATNTGRTPVAHTSLAPVGRQRKRSSTCLRAYLLPRASCCPGLAGSWAKLSRGLQLAPLQSTACLAHRLSRLVGSQQPGQRTIPAGTQSTAIGGAWAAQRVQPGLLNTTFSHVSSPLCTAQHPRHKDPCQPTQPFHSDLHTAAKKLAQHSAVGQHSKAWNLQAAAHRQHLQATQVMHSLHPRPTNSRPQSLTLHTTLLLSQSQGLPVCVPEVNTLHSTPLSYRPLKTTLSPLLAARYMDDTIWFCHPLYRFRDCSRPVSEPI